MTTVYLIRHGQASAGTDDYDRLSELGKKQATLLGEHWQRLDIKPDVAFAGSLKRQQDTASLALSASDHALDVQPMHALDEYNHTMVDDLFGAGKRSDSPTGLTFDDYHDIMARWRDSNHQTADAYESWQSFEKRGVDAILSACQQTRYDSIALFTSGGIVSTVLQHVLNLDFSDTMHSIWQTRNSSVTTLKYNGQKLSMINYNTVSHLEYHADHSLITLI